MSLATRFDDVRLLWKRQGPVAKGPAAEERAEEPTDEIDKSLAEMGRTPTFIAVVWLTLYLVIAFAAWAH